jgi:hypothetical protein
LVDETSVSMIREAFVLFGGSDLQGLQRLQYHITITLPEGESTQPKVTEIKVTRIPSVDSWAYTVNISSQEEERREIYRNEMYRLAHHALCNHYGIEIKENDND